MHAVQNYCHTYGYPKKILTDNGGEFSNAKLNSFCQDNKITLSHGSPRTPTTQGLVERSDRTWKEDLRNIIMGSSAKNLEKWCECTMEAAYTMNITFHRAIGTTPYEAVFGLKAHHENILNTDEGNLPDDQAGDAEKLKSPGKHSADKHERETVERPSKRQKIREQQTQYNTKMIKQTKQAKKAHFKVDDMVAIKIDRVDKTSPIHPNMLLGKIMEIDNEYAKVVTPLGIIKGFIAPSRLNPCTSTNVTLDYSKEISFTSACKQAYNVNN